MADITTTRLVSEMDSRVTFLNALTALTPQSAKIPIYCATDREAIGLILETLGMAEPRIVRIADTLSVVEMEVSEALWAEVKLRPELTTLCQPRGMLFDADGNLP